MESAAESCPKREARSYRAVAMKGAMKKFAKSWKRIKVVEAAKMVGQESALLGEYWKEF